MGRDADRAKSVQTNLTPFSEPILLFFSPGDAGVRRAPVGVPGAQRRGAGRGWGGRGGRGGGRAGGRCRAGRQECSQGRGECARARARRLQRSEQQRGGGQRGRGGHGGASGCWGRWGHGRAELNGRDSSVGAVLLMPDICAEKEEWLSCRDMNSQQQPAARAGDKRRVARLTLRVRRVEPPSCQTRTKERSCIRLQQLPAVYIRSAVDCFSCGIFTDETSDSMSLMCCGVTARPAHRRSFCPLHARACCDVVMGYLSGFWWRAPLRAVGFPTGGKFVPLCFSKRAGHKPALRVSPQAATPPAAMSQSNAERWLAKAGISPRSPSDGPSVRPRSAAASSLTDDRSPRSQGQPQVRAVCVADGALRRRAARDRSLSRAQAPRTGARAAWNALCDC